MPLEFSRPGQPQRLYSLPGGNARPFPLARAFTKIRYFHVGPSNDHERAIAMEVDRLDSQDQLKAEAVPAILALLDFKISGSDYEFLKRYILWRMDNPIVK